MYKIYQYNGQNIGAYKEENEIRISFAFSDPANTDYQTFKQDLANGVALSDAEGTAMTADQIKTFLETLS